MKNFEKISESAMQVITYSGVAKSNYLMALKEFRKNNISEYFNLLKEGDKNYTFAHDEHLSILQDEMNLKEAQITMLLAHAEDQLMAVETVKILVQEIVELLKDIRGYDEKRL